MGCGCARGGLGEQSRWRAVEPCLEGTHTRRGQHPPLGEWAGKTQGLGSLLEKAMLKMKSRNKEKVAR